MLPGPPDLNRCFVPPFAGRRGQRWPASCCASCARPAARRSWTCTTTPDTIRRMASPRLADAARLADGALRRAAHRERPAPRHAHGGHGTTTSRASPIECGRAGDPCADEIARAGGSPATRRCRASRRGNPCWRPHGDLRAAPAGRRAAGRAAGLRARRPCPASTSRWPATSTATTSSCCLPGVPVGWVAPPDRWPLEARGADGRRGVAGVVRAARRPRSRRGAPPSRS
jgi:hypothetical protein